MEKVRGGRKGEREREREGGGGERERERERERKRERQSVSLAELLIINHISLFSNGNILTY